MHTGLKWKISKIGEVHTCIFYCFSSFLEKLCSMKKIYLSICISIFTQSKYYDSLRTNPKAY